MRRFSILIAGALALACLLVMNFGALRSQEGIDVVPGAGGSGSTQVIKTLNLTQADVRSVLMYLSSYGGVNIVASPSVEGNITVHLSNVTWREALDIILQTYNLVGINSDNYIRVVKASDYYTEKSAEEKSLSDRETMRPLETRIFSVKYNVASEIKSAVKGLLSARGTVDVDARTNSLIIRDLADNLARVTDLIGALDKETQQVKISAQLLEVESGFLREIGVDWRLVNQNYNSDSPPKIVNGQPSPDEAAIPPLFTDSPDRQTRAAEEGGVNGSSQVSSAKIGQFSISKIAKIGKENFNIRAVLATVESSNKGKIIAHPEVTTLDNVEAYIQMGQKIPIKQFDPSGNTIITFYDVGTKLRVTPHVTSENRILLHLVPERSSYQFDPNGVIINTQNAETNVVVENGETAVIGGLTNQEINTLKVGLPLLKDIPILGYLFGYNKRQVVTRDLVIFVTPTIVEKPVQAFNDK
jgi:type IV pilus assembly protein PilQ